MVTESFGQLIITLLLLIRFQSIVEKDFKSFGINFQTYIIIAMVISFLTMLHAIYKYHHRFRSSLRPKASLGTALLLITWSMLIVMKVVTYVIAFINTPGLFCVPILIKIVLSFFLMEALVDDFKSKEKHEKFIYLLVSFLLPVSLPSKECKSMKLLNVVNFFLYFLECFFVLIFAHLMKNFYHNKLYCKFYEEFPLKFVEDTNFDSFLAMMCGALMAVTLLSSCLLGIYSKFFHPSTKLFSRDNTKWIVTQLLIYHIVNIF